MWNVGQYDRPIMWNLNNKTVGLNRYLDGRGVPLCIIETTEVEVRSFAKVDPQFAWDESEDDRTLDSWRREHWKFFSRLLSQIGREPSEDMPLVCERFRVVFTWRDN